VQRILSLASRKLGDRHSCGEDGDVPVGHARDGDDDDYDDGVLGEPHGDDGRFLGLVLDDDHRGHGRGVQNREK
jgi:hypothetical protein